MLCHLFWGCCAHFDAYVADHFQMTDWDLAAIGKTTAHRTVHKVTRAICSKRRLLLKFSTDLTEVKRRFFNIAVPKCGGSYRLYSYTCTITRGRQCRGFQKSKRIFFSKRAGDMRCQSYYHEHCCTLARKNTLR